jgi:signal transduction histidine kinase
MNSNFDTVDNLIAYIRRYSAEYLDEHQLRAVIHVPDTIPDLTVSGEKRRNLYLAVKESLHNIVKHARAERVNIDFELGNKTLTVRVRDNGRGIDPQLVNQFGNGLYNMKKRLEDVGGTMTLENDEGTLITFTLPLNPETT